MADFQKLKAAILIISTTASKDPSTDKTTTALQEVFTQDGNDQWECSETKIVPDEVSEIQQAISQWTDGEEPFNAIITSGGTGFAVTDNTPEAVSPLLHKHAPGLVHAMLAASLAVTPFAAMSRPIAGVRHKTLILTLPGSPKGAKENLQSAIKLMPHACQQAAGADSRSLHVGGVKKLEKDAGFNANGAETASARCRHYHPHHHHRSQAQKDKQQHEHQHDHTHAHGHAVPKAHTHESAQYSNDPSLGPTRRHRSSPYPMLTVTEALSQISENIPPPKAITIPVNRDLVGHVLAEDVEAAEAVPAFRASIVDGYAVIVSQDPPSLKNTFPVAFASHAEASNMPDLQKGEIARITTGAPLPPNSNAVVMVEDTVIKSLTEDGKEEKEVEILTDEVKEGENVREVGSDVKAGSVVMKKGEGVSAIGGEFGLLASVGTKQVSVYKKPVIGVLSTGDEIVPHDREGTLKLGEVRDTNRPTLLTAVKNQGFEVVDLGIASDKPQTLESGLRDALSKVDVLITTGGVSMGELDLLKPTIERALGGTIHFGRVSMKPGKPTTFATIPGSSIKDPASGSRGRDDDASKKVVFSLPGNPASAVVTFMLFVLPALHQMSGIKPRGLPKVKVKLDSDVKCDAMREEYHRVVIFPKESNDGDQVLWASSTGGQRSSRIGSFKGANGLLKLPAGGGTLTRETKVEALMMGPIGVADLL